jgi:TolB protein
VNKVGGELRKLTHNDVIDRLPGWSPDGQWIIYASDTRGDETFDLYITREDGSETRDFSTMGSTTATPVSAPMGAPPSSPAASPKTPGREILLLDTQTDEVKQLTENKVRDGTPSFSPDGDHILYTTGGEGDYAIARMNIDGSGKEVIYDSPGGEWAASYSPDGKYVAFVNYIALAPDSKSRDELFIMTADGVEAQLITDTGGFFPSWIP